MSFVLLLLLYSGEAPTTFCPEIDLDRQYCVSISLYIIQNNFLLYRALTRKMLANVVDKSKQTKASNPNCNWREIYGLNVVSCITEGRGGKTPNRLANLGE